MSLRESPPPTIAKGVRFLRLGNRQIAHTPEGNSVVYLNSSAQQILDLCDGTRRASEIPLRLADHHGITSGQLNGDVASALGCLAVEKVVRIGGSILDDLFVNDDAQVRAAHVRFGEATLRVQTTCDKALAELHDRFTRLLALPAQSPEMTLDIIPISGVSDEYAYVHTGGDGTDYSQFFLRGNLDCFKIAVTLPLHWLIDRCAWFHAGSVAKNRSSAIVTGAPGSGKSNITAELCRRGWDYLSDEVLPIVADTLETLPFPLTPLPRKYTADFLPEHRLWELQRDFLRLPDARICARSTSPSAIFLPIYAPGAEISLEPMDEDAIAAALVTNCTSVKWRAEQAVDVVSRLTHKTPAFKLTYDDIVAACDAIEQTMRERVGPE